MVETLLGMVVPYLPYSRLNISQTRPRGYNSDKSVCRKVEKNLLQKFLSVVKIWRNTWNSFDSLNLAIRFLWRSLQIGLWENDSWKFGLKCEMNSKIVNFEFATWRGFTWLDLALLRIYRCFDLNSGQDCLCQKSSYFLILTFPSENFQL
jgi:hypothetical protein